MIRSLVVQYVSFVENQFLKTMTIFEDYTMPIQRLIKRHNALLAITSPALFLAGCSSLPNSNIPGASMLGVDHSQLSNNYKTIDSLGPSYSGAWHSDKNSSGISGTNWKVYSTALIPENQYEAYLKSLGDKNRSVINECGSKDLGDYKTVHEIPYSEATRIGSIKIGGMRYFQHPLIHMEFDTEIDPTPGVTVEAYHLTNIKYEIFGTHKKYYKNQYPIVSLRLSMAGVDSNGQAIADFDIGPIDLNAVKLHCKSPAEIKIVGEKGDLGDSKWAPRATSVFNVSLSLLETKAKKD